ncbi:MAG: ribonuclease HII [Deltaproteobacteria bacterium]|nr:ribonuclease HII [Deltaproteobacteria bacterium]
MRNPVKGQRESQLLRQYSHLTGIDEVGRGCIAGPVYAAAVILDYERLKQLDSSARNLIRDSKTLSAAQRSKIAPKITEELALDFSIGWSSSEEIERQGIVAATFGAMLKALQSLSVPSDYLMIDGQRPLAGYSGKQEWVIRGDQTCYNIAAASILAKVARDQFMAEQAILYPDYGFNTHVGYGTAKHLEAIRKNGICPLHRKNFAPISRMVAALS